ncbi:MAG: helix-turn-helix domain-containing protein [Nitrospirota bacterium]
MVPTPQELARVPREQIPDLLAELERCKAALWARLWTESPAPGNGLPVNEPDRHLTAREASRLLNVSERWLYRKAKHLPFARKLSPKILRFSEAGLRRWQAARKA